jgi:NitT/TauT family transport system permease protein
VTTFAPPGGAATGTMAWARQRAAGVGPPFVAGIVLLALWEGLLRLLKPDGFLLPRPTAIAEAFAADIGPLWSATQTTGYVVVTGLAAGVLLGALAALLVVRFRTADETITPLAAALNAMPIIALAPLFNAWFGILSPKSNQAVVLVVTFFPVFINTARGLTSAEPSQVELMRSYAASEWRITREVRIPNALPLFFTALKIVASLAVIAAIVAEYFGGRQDALGPIIVQRAGLTRYAAAWAAVAAGAAMGIGLYLLAALVERFALPWHAAFREGDR